VVTLENVARSLADSAELFDLAKAENDDGMLESVEADANDIEKIVADLEFRRMFSNPMDPNNCFVDIQAGSGGTEAQDWASMLERMYLKFCERKGFSVEVLEESAGEVAGIKSASLKVSGDYAFGTLRTESGVHRLVRKSPFDSNAPASSCTPKWTIRSRWRSIRPTCGSTPFARAARVDSTSTRLTPQSGSPTNPPVSSCSARTTARSTATVPRPWRC
jgi:hypothetical protein